MFFSSASGTIGFSQSNYTAMEGGESVLICIVLLSQTGPLTGSALIGFSTSLEGFRASGEVDFAGVRFGDPLLCQNLTIPEDDIAEPDQVALLSAFIEGPPSISYEPGGDQATITIIDNDGMLKSELLLAKFNYKLHKCNVVEHIVNISYESILYTISIQKPASSPGPVTAFQRCMLFSMQQ